MTAITQVKQAMEGLAGKVLPNARLISYVESFTGLIGEVLNDEDPPLPLTNEEKAQEFLDILLPIVIDRMRTNVRNTRLTADAPAADQAGDDAVADL